jgi:hypothetical protein
MNFASRHVYAYDLSDEETISDNELEEGMYLSDSGGSGDDFGFTTGLKFARSVEGAEQERGGEFVGRGRGHIVIIDAGPAPC